MRQSLPALAAVTLLAIAGCGGFPAPNPGPEPPTTEQPQYPPGVTEDGLEDARALIDAHRASVREHGAAVTSNTTVTAPLGDEVQTVELWSAGRAAPDGGPVHYESENPRVFTNGTVVRQTVATYADHETVTRRVVAGGNVTVESESQDRVAAMRDRRVALDGELQRTLSAGSFTVASVERRDGRWVTRLVANEGELSDGDDSRGEFSASVEVAQSGRVLSLAFTRDPYPDERVGREESRVTWTNGTTVDAPAWAK